MKRAKTVYLCSQCGHQSLKWAGRCPECGAWSTLAESVQEETSTRFSGFLASSGSVPVALGDVSAEEALRLSTGLKELDRVLGGGLVQGSAVLIGGDPGIGKSTLLLQAMGMMSAKRQVLYISGEESVTQISLRGKRLSVDLNRVLVLTETLLERMVRAIETHRPEVVVIDSIQTAYTELLNSAPGSVSQVRECAAHLVRLAKGAAYQPGPAVLLVGHVTKEGAIAGPRVLEHMVDTVLYFEGEAGSRFRVIRAVKNRFGATGELGVFAMTEGGLKEVKNPSAIFLSRQEVKTPGSCVCVLREGSRPLLVEVQALADQSSSANPRRVTVGMEPNRLAMLLAVLHRHGGVALGAQDVFVNVVGGVRLNETAGDLAVVLAVWSSLRETPLPKELVVFGELGLTGEVRPVPHGEERLREAAKHGFKRAIIPHHNAPSKGVEGLTIVQVKSLSEALAALRE
jgi:DNA repair protein RadA/Sms